MVPAEVPERSRTAQHEPVPRALIHRLETPIREGKLRVAGSSKQRTGYVDQLDVGCVHPDLGGIENPDALVRVQTTSAGRALCEATVQRR